MVIPFGQMEVHPLHGLSNRILGIISAILLARELQIKVVIDWRMDDSKFISAPMRILLNVEWLPANVKMLHNRRVRTNRCDAYYRQREPGWHARSSTEAAALLNGYKIHKYNIGGGFSEPRPGYQFIEYLLGSLDHCNATLLDKAVASWRKRPKLPDIPLEGCVAFFRGFNNMYSCIDRVALIEALFSTSEIRRPLRIGVSLWSPLIPLNGTCAFAILPPAIDILYNVRWLPPKTLGVHVRRGDFDQRWQRASNEEWLQAIEQTMATNALQYLFIASDDPNVYTAFSDHFQKQNKNNILLPRFLSIDLLPREPTKREWASKLWTMDGNSKSLAEQITLASADFILGSWGSTYSTMAAAWFDRPIQYLPRSRAKVCVNATSFAPCKWRGHPNYPTINWKHGQKCGAPLLQLISELRQAKDQISLLRNALKKDARRRVPGRLFQAALRPSSYRNIKGIQLINPTLDLYIMGNNKSWY